MLEATGGSRVVEAEVVNLSLGGMCIAGTELRASDQRWTALLSLDVDQAPLRLAAEAIYATDDSETTCGFRFLPMCDSRVQDQNEDAIWKFLLAEQRRARRIT